MAAVAPGPRTWGVQGGAGPGFEISDAANPLTQFFGPPSKVQFGVQDRLPHETWNLSEFADLPGQTLGPSPFMAVTIEALIVEFDEWPTRFLLPWVHTDRINVDWSVWRFDHTLADVEPEQAPPRYISSEREHHTARLVRRGLAFILEHGFWDTAAGQYAYAMNLKVLQSACHETVQQAVMYALLSEGKAWDRAWNAKYGTPAQDMRSVFETLNWSVAIVNKRELGWYVLDGQLSKFLAAEHVEPDVWIVPPKMRVFASMVPNAETEYYRKGPASQKMLEQGEDAFTTFRGRRVFETRDIDMDIADEPQNPLRRHRAIGDWALMANHFGCGDAYTTESASVSIFNMDVDDFTAVSLYDALEYCQRFDDDGNLHGEHTEMAKRINEGKKTPDIEGSDSDMFLTGIDKFVRPVRYVGDIMPEYWSRAQCLDTGRLMAKRLGTENEDAKETLAWLRAKDMDARSVEFGRMVAEARGFDAVVWNGNAWADADAFGPKTGTGNFDNVVPAVVQGQNTVSAALDGAIAATTDALMMSTETSMAGVVSSTAAQNAAAIGVGKFAISNKFFKNAPGRITDAVANAAADSAMGLLGESDAPDVFFGNKTVFGRFILGGSRVPMLGGNSPAAPRLNAAGGIPVDMRPYFDHTLPGTPEFRRISRWWQNNEGMSRDYGQAVPAFAGRAPPTWVQFCNPTPPNSVKIGIYGLFAADTRQWPADAAAVMAEWAKQAEQHGGGFPQHGGYRRTSYMFTSDWYRAHADALHAHALSPALPFAYGAGPGLASGHPNPAQIAAYASAPLASRGALAGAHDSLRWTSEDAGAADAGGDYMDTSAGYGALPGLDSFAPAGARWQGGGTGTAGHDAHYGIIPGAANFNVRVGDGSVRSENFVALSSRFEDFATKDLSVNDRIGIAAALFTPVTKGAFRHLLDSDIPLPMAFLLCRPFRRYEFGAGILAKGGLGLGASLYGRVNFQFADNIMTKTHVGHLTFYHRAVIKNPRQYVIADCMFLTGYQGGEGVGFFEKREDFNEDEGRASESAPHASVFSFAVPATMRRSKLRNPIDLTGRWHPAMASGWMRSSAEARLDAHHPSAAFYDSVWDFSKTRRAYESVGADGMFSQPDRLPNTILHEGMSWHTNPCTNKTHYTINSCPLGPNVYRGCRAARTGCAEFFNDQGYAKHYQPF